MNSQSLNSQLLDRIEKKTLRLLLSMDFSNIDTDALTLSIDMNYNRSTVSRALNVLHRSSFLIKVHGRPTYYLATKTICDYFGISNLPSDIEDASHLHSLLASEGKSSSRIPCTSFSQLIGGGINESLFLASDAAIRTAMYPIGPHFYSIYGPLGTGKQSFCNALFELEKIQNHATDPIWIDMNSSSAEQQLDDFLNTPKCARACLCFLHTDHASPQFLSRTLAWLNSLRLDNPQQIRAVAFTSESENTSSRLLSDIYPTPIQIRLPSLNERTVKERILFVLSAFQQQCNLLGIHIHLDKPCFQSFLIADYPKNLRSLNDAVRQTCQNAYYRSYPCGQILSVRLQDIPDSIMNHTYEIDAIISTLRSIETKIPLNHFDFKPRKTLDIYTRLRKEKLDTDGLLHQNKRHLSKTQQYGSVIQQVEGDIAYCRDIYKTLQNTRPFKIMMRSLLPLVSSDLSETLATQLYSGLAGHLLTIIDALANHSYTSSFSSDENFSEEELSSAEQAIIHLVENQYFITLPIVEKQYIHLYLQNAGNAAKHRVKIVVLCGWNEMIELYRRFAKELLFENQPIFFHYKSNTLGREHELQIRNILEKMSGILERDEFVIISDEILDEEFVRSVYQKFGNNILFINRLSPDILRKALFYFDDPLAPLSGFGQSLPYHESSPLITESRIASRIKSLISDSLVFLDCNKIYEALYDSLLEILQQAHIAYSDNLATRFIVHSSFLIERCIRGQYLPYKEAKSYLQANGKLTRIVLDGMKSIQNRFNVEIPDTELAYLVEMFTDFL
ncbi:PRD domain-containing protein [Hominifimenecus sp. rT4P-3]|uniref:PRD domain-containing protein n=1 Tax=Hominifimenecus sp. rT4P-3 TaxID=3242979 RepID=UPI003DA3864B